VEYAAAHPLDLMILNETKNNKADFWQHVRDMTGWSVINCARVAVLGDDGRAAAASGGVAIICASPDLAMTLGSSDPRGLLTVEVRDRTGATAPVFIAAAYMPPAGSPYAADVGPLYELLTDATLRAQKLYGAANVVVALDANSRLGCGPLPGPGLRRAVVHSTDRTRTATVGGPLLRLLAAARLLPAAGRSPQQPARSTSRAITGGAGRSVVDYILLPREGAHPFALLPPLPWRLYPVACSHRPLALVLHVPQVQRGAPPPAPPQRPRRWGLQPEYRDKRSWHRIAAALLVALRDRARALALAPPAATPAAGLQRSVETLNQAVGAALDTAIPGPAPRPARPAAAAAAPRATGAAAAAAARLRAGAAAGRRALPLPKPLLELVNRGKAAWRTVKADPANAANVAAAQRLRLAVKHALRDLKLRAREEQVQRLHRLRPHAAKDFFKAVQELAPAEAHLANANGDARVVPAEAGQPPPLERLKDAFKAEAGSAAPDPPAILPGGEAWLAADLVPSAPAGAGAGMDRRIRADEIYNVLYPPQRGRGPIACAASGVVDPLCPICAHHNATRAQWGGPSDMANPAPHHAPTGNAAAAGPPDEWGIAHLRFARPEDPRDVGPFRWSVSTEIAGVLDACLRTGDLPAQLLLSFATSLPKPARAGAAEAPNHASPAFRRVIVLSSALSKLLELVIGARATHFSIRHGLVDTATQGAFIPLANSGFHAYALVDVARGRARRGLMTFFLFCDIKAAYPSVSIAALCVLLARMGFPPLFVDLLRKWGASRMAVLRVNGDSTEPLPVRSGLGAGACHSPILWDLYIASLARYLQSFGAGLRVGANGELSIFMFADDIAAPTVTLAALEVLARRVEAWTVAWGLTLKLGADKTAYIAFYPPSARARGAHLVPLPELRIAAGVVPRVDSYTYLGLQVLHDLTRAGMVDRAAARLGHLLARFFAYNSVLSACDAVTTAQIYKVLGVGAVSYLMALLPCTERAIEQLDKPLRMAARRFLGLGRTAPSAYVCAAAGLPSARYLILFARAQFYLSLLHSPYQSSPAALVFNATRAGRVTAASVRGVPPDWAAETQHLFAAVQRKGGPAPPVAASFADVRRAAAAWARAACAAEARHALPPAAIVGMGSAARPAADAKPTLAVAALLFGGEYARELLGGLTSTPMSFYGVRGPSPLGLTTVPIPGCGTPGLAWAALGALGLARQPLGRAAPSWLVPEGAAPALHAAVARGRHCTACGAGVAATPYHLAAACGNAVVVRERADLERAARAFLPQLARAIGEASRRFDPRGAAAVVAAQLLGLLATHAGAPLSDFLVFRLLLARPYPAGVIPDAAAQPREAALGRLFDAAVLPNSALHGVFNLWVPWAARRLTRLTTAWGKEVEAARRAAAAAPPPPPPAPPPAPRAAAPAGAGTGR